MSDLEIRLLRGDDTETYIVPLLNDDTAPEPIRNFNETMMEWYHRIGKFPDLTVEMLLLQYPSYAISVSGFILELQSGGEKYPKAISISVYNPQGVIVDECNIMYPLPDRPLPESMKWGHGSPVVDASKSLSLRSKNMRDFGGTFRLEPFFCCFYNRLGKTDWREFDEVRGFSLSVFNQNGFPIFERRYLWQLTRNAKFPQEVFDGNEVTDARRVMRFLPPDSKHPEFVPPLTDEDKYDRVVEYVEAERKKRGVSAEQLGTTYRPEVSCESVGKGFNLVECQLIYTREGYGAWKSLYGEVLNLVFNYVVFGKRG